MEAALQSPPPPLPTDSFHSECSRLHFVPFTSPEPKLAPMDGPQPPQPHPDTPTPQPTPVDADKEAESEDSEDVERVEELVVGGVPPQRLNALEIEIPFSTDYVDDEPSSALALRISRATDNPSPPPSPLPNQFQPTILPPEFTEADPNDNVLDLPAEDASAPSDIPPASPSPTPPQPTDSYMQVDNPPSPQQQDLIKFDTVPTLQIPLVTESLENSANAPDSALSAVDALLLASPSSDSPSPTDLHQPTLDEPEAGSGMEAMPSLDSEQETAAPSLPLTPPTTQPLRRSPRKSVAPVIFGTPQGPSTPRPSSRSPKKKKPKLDSNVDSPLDDAGASLENVLLPIQPNSTTDTPRARERSRSRSPLVFSREVGSLSPTTSNLLTQLIPSFTDTTPLQLNAEQPVDKPASSQGMQTFSALSAPAPSEPQPSTPKRPSSPMRPMVATPSPSKLKLQVSAQDVTATPARRIPIEQALESGQLSPLKASQMGFKPQPAPGAPQTPARRVLIAEQPAPTPSTTLRLGSPIRGRSQEPERGSQLSAANSSSQTEISTVSAVHATSAHSIASSTRPSKLPFPLVATEKPTSNGKNTSKDPPSISSPVKSNLKQPTSRIPRIGAKPYSRPPAAAKSAIQKQVPPPAPVSAPKPPTTIRKVELPKPGTSRMIASRGLASSTSISLAKAKGKETATPRSVTPASSAPNLSSSIPSATKRKRSPDKIPSPIKSRMPSSRQAPGSAIVASTSRLKAPAAAKKTTQPALRIRKVVDPAPPPAPPAPPAAASQQPPEQIPSNEPAPSLEATSDGGLDLGSPMKEDPPTQPAVQPVPPPPVVQVPPIPVIQIDPPMETPPIETLPPSEIPQPRRTTRLRKAAVDFTVGAAEPRATNSRRKASQGPRFVFTDAYSEMSATALKQLTITNTVRNQHYLSAKLETEVVKKDGSRPESPMVKIKTIAQRQLEEQAQQRTERAQRRLRRSGEIPGSSDLEMDSDGDGEGNSSDADELPSWPKMRHTRGAGEDEDYETPNRAFKRMKLTEDGVQEVEMDEGKRRVKWDKGLFTTVYLDEVVLGTRQTVKEYKTLRGCLAPTAKALRLDTLGNLEADTPLPDLGSENIIVKKFVYDGELVPEPVVEEVTIPKTRSRSKKANS